LLHEEVAADPAVGAAPLHPQRAAKPRAKHGAVSWREEQLVAALLHVAALGFKDERGLKAVAPTATEFKGLARIARVRREPDQILFGFEKVGFGQIDRTDPLIEACLPIHDSLLGRFGPSQPDERHRSTKSSPTSVQIFVRLVTVLMKRFRFPGSETLETSAIFLGKMVCP